VSVGLTAAVLLVMPASAQAAFDGSNIISDGAFVNIGAMTQQGVQDFLSLKGGFLAHYSEGGRSAAQIIYDAAHGHGDASGSISGITIDSSTGTVNPQVLLVTLQKEQSLITMTSQNDAALNTAMGYGCPDSGGCDAAYKGFTKQVENAAWQLRYNYERAQGHGFSDYQVGQSFCFDDSGAGHGTDCGTYGNRATASLYRYTPHTYNGNFNFYTFFTNYFNTPAFGAAWGGQSDTGTTLIPGQSTKLSVTLLNTGTQTWTQGGSFPVHLGTSHNQDRISSFIREDLVNHQASGWTGPNRIMMQEASVAPGDVGHFTFYLTVPTGMGSGTYREYFQPVADGYSWMNDLGIYWDITVPNALQQYKAAYATQSAYPTIATGSSNQFTVALVNTGLATWNQSTMHLGTSHNQDRISSFIREGDGPSGWTAPNRIVMQETSVAPGATGHFTFWMKAPSGMGTGTYREYFQPVVDGIGWLPDLGIYWDVTVRTPTPAYQDSWGGQSGNVTLSAGQSAQFTLNLKNTGTATWTPGVFHLGTSHNQDRISSFIREGDGPSGWTSPNRIQLQESSVAPGDVGHFVFWMKVPAGMATGTYREYFQPVADGIGWMSDLGIYWDITVH